MRDVFLAVFAGCAALLLESMLISLVGRFLRPSGARKITVLPIRGGEDLERRLRWHLFELDTDPFAGDRILLVIDMGLRQEDTEIARRIFNGRRNCRLCKPCEIEAIVNGIGVCKGVELVLY